MCAAPATAPGFVPQCGKLGHATAADGYFAVTPPRATAANASVAARRAARRVLADTMPLLPTGAPPSAPARMAVAATSPRRAIASVQCATVADAGLPRKTVNAPSSAVAKTTAT